MAEIKHTELALRTLNLAIECCKLHRHEFVMPEHLLYALIDEDNFNEAFSLFHNIEKLRIRIDDFFRQVDSIPENIEYEPELSAQMGEVLQRAALQVASSSAHAIDIPHLVDGILNLEESWASYLLKDALRDREADFMSRLIDFCDLDQSIFEDKDNGVHDDFLNELGEENSYP